VSEPLKVGLLSFAHVHAAGYALELNGRDDVTLLTADPDFADSAEGEVRGREFAEKLGVSYVDTYDELFAWGPDAVVITAENSRHRELAERAAAAGVHVLCEKPLATNVEDGTAIVAACKAAGVSLMTAYPVRFHPAFRVLRDRIRAGGLGKVLSASGTNNGRIPIAARQWFADPVLAGGGSLMDHTVHLADLLDDLLDARAVSVYAQSNKIVHSEVDVETGGIVVVTYSDGTVATIDCSWNRPESYPTWGGLTLRVEGVNGSVSFDAFGQAVAGYDDTAGKAVSLGYGADLDALMVEEFVSAVRDGRRPQPDGEGGLRTLQIVAAGYESAKTGQPVAIPTS
jgi:predicted dehydrogenase